MEITPEDRESLSDFSIAVIGGGATGLTVAYELLKYGIGNVDIYERNANVGGLARTFNIDGTELELGYHHWFLSDTDILGLAEELGLKESVHWAETKVGVLCGGKLHPFTTPMDLLKFSPISIFSRIRLAFATYYVYSQKLSMFEDVLAVDWLKSWSGKSAFEKVWKPLLRGKFGDEYYDKVSMAWIWGKFATRLASRDKNMVQEQLGYPIGGFGQLFDALARKIVSLGGDIYVNAHVEEIFSDDEKFPVIRTRRADLEDAEFTNMEYDAVVLTLSSPVVSRILNKGLSDVYRQKLHNVPYMTADVMVLEMNKSLSEYYWINVVEEEVPFVGVIEHTNMVPPKHYGGKNIVYLTNYYSHTDERLNIDDDSVFSNYMGYLNRFNSDFDRDWVRGFHRFKLPYAQPIMGLSYRDSIPDFHTPVGGVYLASSAQIYPEDRGTNYSVKIGKEVVELMISELINQEIDWPTV